MLAKRKFQNFVNTYGDQSISGKKTFTENLVVTGECTLPDTINITLGPSTIPQSSIVSTTGWIYDTFTELIGSVSDLVSDITNNTFGFLTTTDTISQTQIDQTTENGWISTNVNYLSSLKADKSNPTFTGTVTFPDGSAISSTDEDTTIASKSFVYGYFAPKENPVFSGNNVTFPDSSKITEYLKSSAAASTYAPLASPTFTGTISLNGNVTLASASANTITLNDHLVLCTGSNFTTPVSGQQGYIMTGTLEADGTSISSNTATKYATLNLTYGVWLIVGQVGYYNVNNSGTNTTAAISIKWHTIHTTAASNNLLYGIRMNNANSVGLGIENHETLSRVVTVTSASTSYYLNASITYTGGPLSMYNASSYFHAVRIA